MRNKDIWSAKRLEADEGIDKIELAERLMEKMVQQLESGKIKTITWVLTIISRNSFNFDRFYEVLYNPYDWRL